MATATQLLLRVEPPPPAIFTDTSTLFPLLSPLQFLSLKPPKPKNHIHRTFNSKPLHVPFSNPFKNGSNNSSADTSCPVPFDQQPINEYQTLSTSFPFSWAAGDFVEYCSRLFVTGASFALLIGLPVAWLGAPGADAEPLKRILAAASSGVFVVTLAVVRMYLGWAYVGNRLLSATVECNFESCLVYLFLYDLSVY